MAFFGTLIATLLIGTQIASGLDLYPTKMVGIRKGGRGRGRRGGSDGGGNRKGTGGMSV